MSVRKTTYGISFPFEDSQNGDYFKLTTSPIEETKTMLIHYFMTDKGSRYMYPEFGTRLKYLLFDQNDEVMRQEVTQEIYDVENYIPNVKIKGVNYERDENRSTLIVSINYLFTDNTFEYNDNITIEL